MDNVVSENNQEMSREYHGVPIEDALANLEGFLASLDNPTRADNPRRIGSVEVVRNRNLATRSIAVSDADSLIYVVNFEDEQGFALLAADDRVSSPLIFIGDSGSFDWGDHQATLVEQRTIYPDYPTTGPGTFYDNAVSPGELFMNPNTFNLYDSVFNDHWVGDFYYNGDEDYEAMLNQVKDLSINFIDKEIIQDENGDNIYQEIEYEHGDIEDEAATIKIVRHTVRDTVVHNLLDFAKRWEQGDPYNFYCPLMTQWFTHKSKKASVGCFPLAIAKIMTYFQYPGNLVINGRNINWFSIRNSHILNSGEDNLAWLLNNIGFMCESLYFYPGTFTFPHKATNYMRNMGYTNVNYINYNDNSAQTMLDNNCPFIICSIPVNGIFCDITKSHAWNIDGYLIANTITTRYFYDENDNLIGQNASESEKMMVHCDFGWEGKCNGYFTSGVFNLESEDVLYDDEEDIGYRDYNYKWYVKMIQYDRPN